MQKGADYGSQNLEEESAFIRRVVAPPKRNDNTRRRQKRVAAAVGASVVLLAAGAIATYASIPSENASTIATTETLEADAMARPVTLPPVEEDDVDDATDDSTPNPDDALFSLYDANGDGTVTKDEYIAQLSSNRDEALAKVEASTRLSPDEKTELVRKLNSNFAVESSCATKLAKRDIVSNGEVTSDRFPIFYHMIKQFCLLEDVNIPEEYRPTDPPVEQIEVPEEQPVEEFTPPAYEEMNPVQEPTPAYEEPAVEEDNTPANNPEVVEDEKKEDNVEQAAESGDETAVKEVEQQADEVEQAAESGDAAAVAEEEHHEAEVEQAAEEGNPAAQQEEEHHEEQVEEADVEAPPAVKEEENKIDEVEQSAESGDQTAVEEVEQKEDELVQEAESGDAEAAQEEEHIEAAVEEAASEGNPAAQEVEEHHEEEVQQSEETQEAESPSKPWSPESSTSESPAEEQQTWSEIPETTSEEDNQAPAEDWLSPVVDELATPTPEEEEAPKADTPTVNGQTYMTKPEFRSKISDHFQDLEGVVAQRLQLAELEVKKVGLLKDLLEECIDQASNKFGYYGVYERDDIFNDAVTWVKDDCLAV